MNDQPGPLTGFRVVDLATPRAEMAGRVMADLGAEVIKVEPPEGAPARRLPPFDGRTGDSLYWAAVGLGKRSVVLDLDPARTAERARLFELIDSADVLVESFDPGHSNALGLDYSTLSARNPGLVYVSVTPFGRDGPEAQSPATDLTLEAAGGLISLQGDRDRPPVPVGYPQASFHAGTQAAADAIIALNERERSGLGQHLDVSMQAAMVWTLMNANGYPPNVGSNPPGTCETRTTPPELVPGLRTPAMMACAGGYFLINLTLPVLGPRTAQAIAEWIATEGSLPAELEGLNWNNWLADLMEGRKTAGQLNALITAMEAFFQSKTKREIQEFALASGTILSPVYTTEDLALDPQLAARDYWVDVGGRRHPGPFARMSRTAIRPGAPAPSLGADQEAIADRPSRPRLAPGTPGPRGRAFEGVKVADFAWVGVGPMISKALADHGATVVRVESESRPDILRLLPPFKDGRPGLNRSQFWAFVNTSKSSLSLNLGTAAGRALARRLADWADVVVESFTPGTMARFGLDYETLSRNRPDLVMLSTCLRGQTGPEAAFTGFGAQGAGLAGIHAITGWPDRPPAGPWGAFTDFISPRFGVAALASAVLHRGRTGCGQYIDLAQGEAGIRFIEPLVLDYAVNGRIAAPAGHSSSTAAPHGVYRCAGQERYLAIAVETPAQWRSLAAVAPLGQFDGGEYDDLAVRLEHGSAIDAALAAWCLNEDAFVLGRRLRECGVPAFAVQRPSDLYEDPQLAHRGFFVTLNHREMGPTPYDGLVTRFSATPAELEPAPCMGEDTATVLQDLLGMSDEEIGEAAAAGALA